MFLTADQYRRCDRRAITLLGMSGVGKTHLSSRLRLADWFHYSGDYRIGTRYLDEEILDNIKLQAVQVPFLRELLRSDSIQIVNHLSVDNLAPVSSFLGKLGNPELGGLPLKEFKRRQRLHEEAEIEAMRDVPKFIDKAHRLFGHRHFINDAGGSVCEIDAPDVLPLLAEHTIILYLRADETTERTLIERAKKSPKPLFYREDFLDEHLSDYLELQALQYVAEIDPDDFVRWIFPRLFHARIPRYDAIARQYGYRVAAADVLDLRDATDFDDLLVETLSRAEREGR
ncbi:MAG: ATPase [Thioalkalivibrionaceae bacterium]